MPRRPMPRVVRNFWLDGHVDGSQSDIATGPKSIDGGFNLHILQRSDGDVLPVINIDGYYVSDGVLKLRVWDVQRNVMLAEVETKR